MKTNTEYPATHSMSTAWYIVADDGNVGILDYNENGPATIAPSNAPFATTIAQGKAMSFGNHKR